MNYTSTRNASLRFSSSHCFVQGISEEGGLFVPESFPVFSEREIAALADVPYSERAFRLLSRYLTDFSAKELRSCIAGAYGTAFDTPAVCPLRKLDGKTFVMELYHGPTLAFKDVALQILPHFLRIAKQKEGVSDTILILVATSGDTGKAALEGFADVDGMAIAVFFPNQGVSRMQQLQMTTQEGKNVFVCAVNGNFDDTQTGVKEIFTSPDVRAKLQEKHIRLSSANSINWGRLVPQIVYYFSAYADLLRENEIASGQPVDFVVPTGNFGDILAGYYAKRMGLPIRKLVCASNKNRVLTDFFETGVYDANRAFFKTASPSMDILISSNLERLLFELSGRDDAFVSDLMRQLKETGQYRLPDVMHRALTETWEAGCADEAQTARAIRDAFDRFGYCIDTHTAVGYAVQARRASDVPTVLLSTASPYKFPRAVLSAVEGTAPEDEFAAADRLAQLGVPMPDAIANLHDKAIRHKTVCEKATMAQAVLSWEGETL
ncbi:MAG: threonine synthase [Clostridia bacterium]|nr:threonine synthase [Clostridia bacterium]